MRLLGPPDGVQAELGRGPREGHERDAARELVGERGHDEVDPAAGGDGGPVPTQENLR